MLISAIKNNTVENKLGVGGYFIKVSDVGGRDFYSEETARAKTLRVEHTDDILGKVRGQCGCSKMI